MTISAIQSSVLASKFGGESAATLVRTPPSCHPSVAQLLAYCARSLSCWHRLPCAGHGFWDCGCVPLLERRLCYIHSESVRIECWYRRGMAAAAACLHPAPNTLPPGCVLRVKQELWQRVRDPTGPSVFDATDVFGAGITIARSFIPAYDANDANWEPRYVVLVSVDVETVRGFWCVSSGCSPTHSCC